MMMPVGIEPRTSGFGVRRSKTMPLHSLCTGYALSTSKLPLGGLLRNGLAK